MFTYIIIPGMSKDIITYLSNFSLVHLSPQVLGHPKVHVYIWSNLSHVHLSPQTPDVQRHSEVNVCAYLVSGINT